MTPTQSNLKELLAAYAAKPTIEVRNQIVEHFLPMVDRIAGIMHNRLPKCVQYDDLFAWGNLGLIEAVDHFDPACKVRFSSFAYNIVRLRMVDGLRESSPKSRMTLDRAKQMVRAEERLSQKLSRRPSPEEVIDELGVTEVYKAKRYLASTATICSMDQTAGENVVELRDTLIEPSTALEVIAQEARDIIGFVLDHCSITDALIMKCRFIDGQTLPVAAEWTGICVSSVSHRICGVLRMLRARFAA